MKRRSLILGGTGFIGLRLAHRILAVSGPEDELILTDNFSRGRRDQEVEVLLANTKCVRLIEIDLTKPNAFERIEGAFDHVYLLASMVGVKQVETFPEQVLKTNTLIILGALEWMARSRSSRIFFSSTSENYAGAYNNGLLPVPTPELVPLVISDIQNPRFSYAVTKIWGEAAAIFYGARYGFTSVIGRYHNIYGPRMGYDHVIPQLSVRIVRGEDPLKVMSPEQTRAFCHVDDAVEATRLLMEVPLKNGTIVNIGNNNEELAIGELAKRLLKLAGRKPEFVARPAPHGSVARRAPALDLLHQLTSFYPAIVLDKGLAETFAWYCLNSAESPTIPPT